MAKTRFVVFLRLRLMHDSNSSGDFATAPLLEHLVGSNF